MTSPAHRLTPEEELELMALVGAAFDLRGTPAAGPAAAAIVDWWDALLFRRAQRYVWRREARLTELVALLRATDPARIQTRDVEALHAA